VCLFQNISLFSSLPVTQPQKTVCFVYQSYPMVMVRKMDGCSQCATLDCSFHAIYFSSFFSFLFFCKELLRKCDVICAAGTYCQLVLLDNNTPSSILTTGEWGMGSEKRKGSPPSFHSCAIQLVGISKLNRVVQCISTSREYQVPIGTPYAWVTISSFVDA